MSDRDRKYLKCSTCGYEAWSDDMERRLGKQINLRRKRFKLIGVLYAGWLALMGFMFLLHPIAGFLCLGAGVGASFIGLIVYVVNEWDRL